MDMEMGLTADFWLGLFKIIWINVILSGDNAVVIALAARALPPHQQIKAVAFGSSAAVVLRVMLTIIAAKLLAFPYLQVVGGLLLLWIGFQLLLDKEEAEEAAVDESGSLFAAVRTILVADLIMSLDNVIAVAAAAKGSLVLLVLGLAISIPLVIFGSTLLIKLMGRFPIMVVAGAGLIGWVGGEAIVSDAALQEVFHAHQWLLYGAPALGAATVVAGAKLFQLKPVTKTR